MPNEIIVPVVFDQIFPADTVQTQYFDPNEHQDIPQLHGRALIEQKREDWSLFDREPEYNLIEQKREDWSLFDREHQ